MSTVRKQLCIQVPHARGMKEKRNPKHSTRKAKENGATKEAERHLRLDRFTARSQGGTAGKQTSESHEKIVGEKKGTSHDHLTCRQKIRTDRSKSKEVGKQEKSDREQRLSLADLREAAQ
jgi:hypothetical protein